MITLHIFARITCLHGYNLGPFGRLSVRNVPCQWSGWCDWTACGATCGAEAVHSRTRDCLCDDQIDPSSRGCLGDDHEVEPCGDTECPEEKDEGKFLIKKKFEKSRIIVVHTFHLSCICSQNRFGCLVLNCYKISEKTPGILKNTAVDDIFHFWHSSFFHFIIHMILECWTPWSEWGSCCGDCGNGERERSRSCTCGPPGCSNCPGDDRETEPCNEQSIKLWYFYPQRPAQLNLASKYPYVKTRNPGFITKRNHRTVHLRANSCSLHD